MPFSRGLGSEVQLWGLQTQSHRFARLNDGSSGSAGAAAQGQGATEDDDGDAEENT